MGDEDILAGAQEKRKARRTAKKRKVRRKPPPPPKNFDFTMLITKYSFSENVIKTNFPGEGPSDSQKECINYDELIINEP